MTNYYITDTELEGIASAISECGISKSYSVFPKDYMDGVVSISDYGVAWWHRDLTSYNNSNITEIGNYALADQYNLSSINLPNCSTVGSYAFKECYMLSTISLPKCQHIHENAFISCYNLSEIHLMNNSITTLSDSKVFKHTQITESKGSIYVPSALLEEYKTATNWVYFSNQIFSE